MLTVVIPNVDMLAYRLLFANWQQHLWFKTWGV